MFAAELVPCRGIVPRRAPVTHAGYFSPCKQLLLHHQPILPQAPRSRCPGSAFDHVKLVDHFPIEVDIAQRRLRQLDQPAVPKQMLSGAEKMNFVPGVPFVRKSNCAMAG
jgi:hypothetical protein